MVSNFLDFGPYKLWKLQSSSLEDGFVALEKGEVDGFSVSQHFGFREKNLECLNVTPHLRVLAIGTAYDINLVGLENLAKLNVLSIGENSDAFDFRSLPQLQELYFTSCKGRVLPSDGLINLRRLSIWSYENDSLDVMRNYSRLQSLTIIQSKNLVSLSGMESLGELSEAVIAYCPKLRDISSLASLKLNILDFENTKKISGYDVISSLNELSRLVIDKSAPVEDLGFLVGLKKLKSLVIRATPILSKDISPIKSLTQLEHLYLDNKKEYLSLYAELEREVAMRKGQCLSK